MAILPMVARKVCPIDRGLEDMIVIPEGYKSDWTPPNRSGARVLSEVPVGRRSRREIFAKIAAPHSCVVPIWITEHLSDVRDPNPES